ncbi:LrgB family protein [Pseudomonas putida]|uniref:LrgB family protein n=1 Tax=Pseudomonas putida TaxID=303 RepID=A0ABD7B5S8_PSEPU|nr:LrgB family protein [Pseudomonas putida]QOC95466.1 LrgB family protein [Pseudomonas putida]
MISSLLALWTPLAVSPLLWLSLSLLAFVVGQQVQRRCAGTAWANPVLIAIVLMVVVLQATGTGYDTYYSGAQFINFLLGPATVALAVPLALSLSHVRRSLSGVGLALLAGSLTTTLSGVVLVWLLGGDRSVALSMAPKSVTTPIAMALSEEVGGVPALTASLAIAGGIVAAVLGRSVLGWLRVDDWRAHGLAAGVAGSGVAAAQIAPLSGLGAAFAAVGIGLNGLLTAVIVPLISSLWPA